MTAIHDITDFPETNASTRTSTTLTKMWKAFEASRKRRRLRSELHSLSDQELSDMGTTRGEIEHIVLNFRSDQAAVLHCRRLPAAS
jgi:uncharacterized protein YjiS (DUF1127 family)